LFFKKRKLDNVVSEGFVQDLFFEKNNWGLKIREVIVPTILWLGFFYSQATIINSYTPKFDIPFVYKWSSAESKLFTNYVSGALIISFWIILIVSVYLLLRNNYREKIYFEKYKLYDEEKMLQRADALDEFYEKRFGDLETRQAAKFYSVKPEQNFQNGEVEALFQEKGLEIK